MTAQLQSPLAGVGQDGRHLYTCPLCEAMCGLEIQVTDGTVATIRGNPRRRLEPRAPLPEGRDPGRGA